jgi:hypothetical protein
VRDGADSRARLIERRGRSDQLGRHEPKQKTYSRRDATDVRAGWAGNGGFGMWGQRGQQGWLGQRPSGPVKLAGLKVSEKDFWIKNWIFEFTKALEICKRRFRRNFDMGIFPKFF